MQNLGVKMSGVIDGKKAGEAGRRERQRKERVRVREDRRWESRLVGVAEVARWS